MSGILCRLCALKCDEFVDIYESENSNMELDTKIGSCLQIWVSKEDILPKTVCRTCCAKLDESFDFFQNSTKAQATLREIYETPLKNCKSEKTDSNVEFPNEPHLEPTEIDGEEFEVEKRRNQKDVVSKPDVQCSLRSQKEICLKNSYSRLQASPNNCLDLFHELDSTDDSLEVPFNQATKLSTIDHPDDNHSDEVMNLIGVIQKKSRRHKKYENVDDIPANPRLPQELQEYSWPCTICDERNLNTLQELKDHYESKHEQQPIFKCPTCEKQYDRYRSFTKHIKIHSNPKRYSCDKCGKSFAQRSVLLSHAVVHTSEKPHVCQTCGKSFKNFSSLYVHGKRHLPELVKEKYCCDYCEKVFSTRHTLETHKKIHTGERNFVCDICGKAFVAKGSLDYHLLTHTGDKNHVCSTCGKAFKTARLLGKHTLTHSGIKPHQCDVCGKQFRERGALREHSRIHTGAMPYSCEVCGKSFRFRGILTVHRRQHTGERPYACLECRRYFTNWANYNKHMKRIHHCDTSSRENSRKRPHANNIQLGAADIENSRSVLTAEEKTDPYSTSRHNASQKYEPTTEPALDVDHSE